MTPSPLRGLLLDVRRTLRIGHSPAKAWQARATAAGMPVVQTLVTILMQAMAHGAPVGHVLATYSETLRRERVAQAERLGAIASQKLLLPA